ncbi:MAG: hypothetical protein M2R45_03963 [Verrucomicrobia subdivision 3 bacterium]|nr:hypothetical protein [Limisphaerales bacterium]MCS1415517.1 hypothetical protein [Limisphaerales bacterium]
MNTSSGGKWHSSSRRSSPRDTEVTHVKESVGYLVLANLANLRTVYLSLPFLDGAGSHRTSHYCQQGIRSRLSDWNHNAKRLLGRAGRKKANDSAHLPEQLHYVAIKSGQSFFNANSQTFETTASSAAMTKAWTPLNFGGTFDNRFSSQEYRHAMTAIPQPSVTGNYPPSAFR